MNHLVVLDTRAGELEKILSGVKTMLIQEFDPAQRPACSVNPGDVLYLLKDNGESAVRVQATVVRVLPAMGNLDRGLSCVLKEMQSRLQLTEDQYSYWSAKERILLVELGSAHKIGAIHVALPKIAGRTHWIPFEESGLIA